MSLEQLVICHCAPVLRGMKVSNLLSCSYEEYPFLEKEMEVFSRRMRPFGLECSILCRCKRFALVLVYDLKKLDIQLTSLENSEYLAASGYSAGSLQSMLVQLSRRLSSCSGFPHEIGVFLGYPLADVAGFTENCGKNFKYSGYWKVYGDLETAKAMFKSYDLCRKECTLLAMNGGTLEEIIACSEKKSA